MQDVAPAVSIAAPAEVDSQFQSALRLIDLGQVAVAIPILQRLYDQTRAPRIRLELARALWLAGRVDEARTLFVEAFKNDPPPVVKANVLAYIDRIDRQKGKLTLSASVARYDNPLQQPGAYTLNFAGIDLTFEPDATYRQQWGVNVGGSYTKEFKSGWQLSTAANYRELPGNMADRLAADVSVSRQVRSMPLEIKLGATRLDQKGQSFTLPYTQAAYAFQLSSKNAVRPTVTLGYYAADAGKSGSGIQVEAFAPFVHSPLPTKFFAIGPTILKHSAGYGEQAYTSLGIRGIASFQTDAVNVELGAQGTVTRFDAVDPFWGVRRKDRGLFATAMISSYKLRIGPFVPAFGVTCSVSGSTVAYYRQQGCDTLFEVRKLF